jgi:hypothetical protein
MHRRDFIATSAVSATAAAVAAPTHRALAMPASPPSRLNRATFRSWLGGEFRVSAGSSFRTTLATLVAVDDGPRSSGLEQFSVVLGGATPLPTGLCWVSHADGALFLLHLHGPSHSPRRRAHFCLLEPHNG